MSLTTSYADLFKTDMMDERIKNSFNSTTSMLTKAYSRSMPDLSAVQAPRSKTSLEEPILPSQTKEPAVKPIELPILEPPETELNADNLIGISESNLRYNFTEYDKVKQESAELKHKRMMNLKDMLGSGNVSGSTNQANLFNNGQMLVLSPRQDLQGRSPRDIVKEIVGAEASDNHLFMKDQDGQIKLVHKKDQQRRSIADEYKRFQVEIAMNDQYNQIYTMHDNFNVDKPLSNRDSLESFRIDPNAIPQGTSYAKSINSLDTYTPPQHSDNDRPLSEPPKPANTQPVPITNPAHSYAETIAIRYPHLQKALSFSGESPLFNPGMAGEMKPFHNKTDNYYEIERIEQDDTEQGDDAQENERDKQDKIEQKKCNPQKSSYAELQSRREEMKNKTNKRVKKKSKSKQGQKKQTEKEVQPEKAPSCSGEFYCRCSDEEPAEDIDAKESQDHAVKPPSFLDGMILQNPHLRHLYKPQPVNNAALRNYQSNAPKPQPINDDRQDGNLYDDSPLTKQYLAAYKKQLLQEEHQQYSLSDNEQNKQMYEDSPLTKQYFAKKNGYEPAQDETYSKLYSDSPYAQKYFAQNKRSHYNSSGKALPPLKPKSAGGNQSPNAGYMSDHTAYSTENKRNKAPQVDPLAFKLRSTNQDDYMVKRNKMLRQKEYAEILRQQQQDMTRQKPQVRSWNVKSNDDMEREYQQSKRNAAINYAREIAKPVVAKPKSPPSQLQQEREHAIDAIEVMKKRHEEDKRAIEEMRAHLNMRVAQASA